MIVSTDVKCEADDPFAIMHHLLTPSEDVKAIIAAHNEGTYITVEKTIAGVGIDNVPPDKREIVNEMLAKRGSSMETSYQEGKKILELAQIDDVPMMRGSAYELFDTSELPESEGADFIINEAMKEDDRSLYVVAQGACTDIAIAYLKKPEIAGRFIFIWIGGGVYPHGGMEFNLNQDILAANILFESPVDIWQIPINTYQMAEVSLTELFDQVEQCGAIGGYLCKQMCDFNMEMSRIARGHLFPHGESWCLGDNPTVTVLLQGAERKCWKDVPAPTFNEDCSYGSVKNQERMIRVYDYIDSRLMFSDFFSKMKRCYGNNKIQKINQEVSI